MMSLYKRGPSLCKIGSPRLYGSRRAGETRLKTRRGRQGVIARKPAKRSTRARGGTAKRIYLLHGPGEMTSAPELAARDRP